MRTSIQSLFFLQDSQQCLQSCSNAFQAFFVEENYPSTAKSDGLKKSFYSSCNSYHLLLPPLTLAAAVYGIGQPHFAASMGYKAKLCMEIDKAKSMCTFLLHRWQILAVSWSAKMRQVYQSSLQLVCQSLTDSAIPRLHTTKVVCCYPSSRPSRETQHILPTYVWAERATQTSRSQLFKTQKDKEQSAHPKLLPHSWWLSALQIFAKSFQTIEMSYVM